MNTQPDPMEKALRNIGVYRMFRNAGHEIQIACLIRKNDWRPLKAPWWHGKEVCIIGADLTGNFFLRHCDGTVRYWDHSTKTDTTLAPSVRDFVAAIGE
jgi:hypothetical protein